MKKRLLSLFLAICMVLGMLPVGVFASETTAPFTVTVGGEEMTGFALGEVTDPYNGTVPLYTVTIPAGTTEVTITWNDGNNYTLSYYDANCNYFAFESGMQNSWTVAMDKNGDGAYDMLQVYDSGYGVPYWITFADPVVEEPEEPTAPFTVTVGGEEMTEFVLGEVSDPYNGTKPLYTFTIPEGSTEAVITWAEGTYTLSYYDGNTNAYIGASSGHAASKTVPTDYNGDGTYDNIQVYDSGWDVPYWIAFVNPVAEEPAEPESVTVYMTVNEKGAFITAPNGTPMALVEMTVPYFDLAEYGLEALYYNPYCYVDENGNTVDQTAGTKEDAEGVVTMLHLFIWATEVYYNELDPAEAGQGWLAENGWNGFEIWQQVPGSAFINFWSFGMNLNYYLNYEYPLGRPGWGSTLDQIALTDGDIVSVRYNAATGTDGAYYHFGADGDLSKSTTQANDVVLTMYQCTESLDYTTGHERVGEGETVYVSPTVDAADAVATYTTDANGQITVETSELEGTYYVFSDTWDPAVMYLIVESASHVHSYTAVVTEPTCEEGGYTTYTCSCGESYDSDFVDATGHDFVDGVCTVCGEEKTMIPEGARFIDITTDVDGASVVEAHEVDENFKSYFGDYPYYHVVIPEDAQYLYITYPANSLTVSQWSYAQAVAVPLPWDPMNNYTSNLELQTVTNEDGTQTVSILVKDYITQIPNDGTGIVMRNENYNFGEMFTIGYQIPVGFYDVSIPTSDRYTVTGELIAQDGYTFNVSINEGYMAGADFAVKVNGETVATEPGDITLDSVAERVIITVEGVLLEVGAPDLFINVDLTEVEADRYLDSSLSWEGIDVDWNFTENVVSAGETTTFSYSVEQYGSGTLVLQIGNADGMFTGFQVGDVVCEYAGSYKQYNINEEIVGYMQNVNYTFEGVTYDFLQFEIRFGNDGDMTEPGTWDIKPIVHEHTYENGACTVCGEADPDAGPEPVTVTVKGMHSAQISAVKLYTYTDGVKGDTDLLEGVETTADGYMYLYNTALVPGDYWAEGYDANGDCNGGIKLTVTEDGENTFYLQRVYQIYATNSGWVLGTDYTIDVKVTDQQRNEREITTGTANTYGTVYTSCLFIYGDTVEATLTPIGERAETCMPTTISKTGTSNMYISGKISETLNMTIVVPEGSAVDLGKFSTYYIYDFYQQTENPADLELEAGMTAYTFNVPKESVNMSSGPYFFYRVQNEAGVTYWDFFAPASYTESAVTVTLTAEQLFIGSEEFNSDTIYHNYEKNTYDTADIYLNINSQGYMDLDVGETFELNVFRNWMAIENFYNRRVALPDMHYEVITVDGSDVITIEPDAKNSSVANLTATGEGTAIVLVTYDAVYSNCAYVSGSAYQPGYFSAIWPENTGVFVVTVGSDGTSIETGMTIDRNGTTGALDAEHDHLYYLGSEGASYTFTPEAGTTVTVSRSTVSATDMTFGDFVSDGVTVNADGSVTVSGLTEGRHIVKVEKDGTANYQVITAKQTAYELQDADGNVLTEEQIAAISAGDTVYVQFSGLANPCEKMSGVYNHAPAVLYAGEDGSSFVSSGTSGIGVYGFGGTPSLQKVAITIPKYWTADSYSVDGYIRMNTSGSAAGSHRGVTYAKGLNANFNATVGSNVLCALPDITFTLAETAFLTGKLEFVDQNGDAVTADLSIAMTDADGNVVAVNEDYTFGCLAGEYSFIINGAGVRYHTGSVTVAEDSENVFTITLTTTGEGAWDGVTVTEPAQDENGVYLISNGAEMAWFSQQNQNNKADISGKLTADIDLACYPWNNTLTYANYATVLEGDGHSITNLNATRGIFGALGANSGVRNLTVSGTVSGGSQAGSVAGYINGANTVIENIVNYASVSGTNCTGGIVGTTYSDGIIIRNCINYAVINTTGSNVGGIVGSTGTAAVEGCYNTADISGGSTVGGIFGLSGYATAIVACYNTGDISGTNNIGGVGGNLSGPSWGTGTASLRDCYSTGTVTATNTNVGGALGYYSASKATVERLYYLEGAYTSDPAGTMLTAEQLKCAELDPAYFGGTCSGYPALLWQTDVVFHSTEGEGVVTVPTCTEKGYTTYTCDACGADYNAEYVDATGHAWCEDTEGCESCVYTAPTCTAEGSIVRSCLHEGCEATKTDMIPATGHTEDESQTLDHEIYKDCVCAVCGEGYRVWDDDRLQYMTLDMDVLSAITLEDNDYPWSYNASTGRIESTNKGVNSSTSQTSVIVTLTDTAKVSFSYGVSSESNYDKLTITAASGETVIATIANAISGTQESAFSYELEAGTYTLTFAYTKDSSSASGSDIGWFRDVVIHAHSYESVVTAPTCTEGGYTTYTCSCGDSYTADETDALGHSYVAGVCTVCGAEDPDYVPATVTVHFSLSDDANFLVGDATGAVMALKEITVPYFDLALYGMESFYFSSESYGDDGDGNPGSDLAPGTPEYAEGKITMLHLFIYATEVYYCGVDASEAGQGYLYEAGLMPGDALDIGGSQGSSFINYIWGMDMNLNYYLNYEYPLASEGWGATSDQILLEDGDVVTLGHFTSWSFFNDSTSIFNYMVADSDTVMQGEEVNLTLYHAGADFSGDYTTAHTVVDYCPDVYYIALDDMASGDVTEWNYLGSADENGGIVLDTTDLEPGRYMVAMAGQYGAENPGEICSTPGGVLLTVEEPAVIASGWSGYTTWALTEDGVLTVSPTEQTFNGKCNMRNYWKVNGVLTLPWSEYAEQITTVVIEEGVNAIGQMAFYELPNLTTVVLPESLEEIRNYAFKNVTTLTDINLENVDYIREGAFYGCTALTDVTLAEGVVVEDWAFSKSGVTLN